ncbi:MAG TPA: hypothetical protein DIU00_16085 [Phycisphaerales bacterium]|nr:hypothetical protein [Phycisphaerales bacterium]
MKTPLDKDLNEAYKAFNQDHDHLRQMLMASLPSRSKVRKQTSGIVHIRAFVGDTDMTRKITKLAVAAVIIIVVLISISQFGGSFDGASQVFASMLEEMQKIPWVHAVMEVDQSNAPIESWVSFNPSIMILKGLDGTVMYVNFSQEVRHVYSRDSNRITVSTVPDTFSHMGPKTAFEMIGFMIDTLETSGARITREKSVLDGIQVEIIHAVSDVQDVIMIRDIERNLPISAEYKALDNTPDRISGRMRFYYPEKGPSDIYAVGVPKDADIFDTRPEGSLKDLTKNIQDRFDQSFGDYIAVVLESSASREDPTDPSHPNMVLVMRRLGQLWRLDRYMAVDTSLHKDDKRKSLYEGIKDIWANPTIAKILELEDKKALIGQVLFDGKYSISCTQIRGKVHKSEWRGDASRLSTEVLPAIVWTNPFMLTMGNANEEKVIESMPVDPNHSQLIGLRVRTVAKDKNKDSGQDNQPREGTDDYWFDPARDYILVEHSSRRDVGQKGGFPFSRSVVTAVAQTSDCRWYPKIIRTEYIRLSRSGEKTRRVREKRILLDTRPTFEQGIFDESSLLE